MSSVCRNLFSLLGERNREWSERGGCWGTTEKGNEDGNQSTAIVQFWIVSSQAPWRLSWCVGMGISPHVEPRSHAHNVYASHRW